MYKRQENNAKNNKNVKTQCAGPYIIYITSSVYARFKSVNLKKYYKQTNYYFVGAQGHGPLNPALPSDLENKANSEKLFIVVGL